MSTLDTYLKQHLGLAGGLGEVHKNKPVREWIRHGGEAEDEFLGNELLGAALRSIHHFHNPLMSWDRAGLDALSPCPPFLLRGAASVRWAQDPNQGVAPNAAWDDARRNFREGLILASKEERDAALARTFQILGQQMHLIADLAVPAHTRNDPHCPFPEGFEAWSSGNLPLIQDLISGPPVRPDPAIFAIELPSQEAIAIVPVARLSDTDRYEGTNPNPATTLSPTIGLAEYTNANFFSEDTVFNLEFPFPATTSVELGPPESEPRTGELRRYFQKVRDGELIDHLAVPSALYEFLPDALKDKKVGLDDKVFHDYAAKLLPRAVGYSAALLDYFFRGRLEARSRVAYDSSGRPGIGLYVRNRTPGEALAGILDIYYDSATGTRVHLTGAGGPLTLEPEQESAEPFFIPTEPPGPSPDVPGRYLLVFKGTVGGERDEAIIGTRVTGGIHTLVLEYGGDSEGAVEDSGRVFFYPHSIFTGPAEFALGTIAYEETGIDVINFPGGPSSVYRYRSGYLTALYRDPSAVPGDLATITLTGTCRVASWEGEPSSWPVTARLVEFDDPGDVARLTEYSGTRLPPIARVLHEFSVDLPAVDAPTAPRIALDIKNLRFFGVQLLSELPDPPTPPTPEWGINSVGGRCWAHVGVHIPR